MGRDRPGGTAGASSSAMGMCEKNQDAYLSEKLVQKGSLAFWGGGKRVGPTGWPQESYCPSGAEPKALPAECDLYQQREVGFLHR